MSFFTLQELTHSNTATARGIENVPTDAQAERLLYLISKVLDPLRTRWGSPIRVNNGFRSEALNRVIPGSARTSQHMCLGPWAAADLTAGSHEKNRLLYGYIKQLVNKECVLSVDQCILEKGGAWVHLSARTDGKDRQQFLELP